MKDKNGKTLEIEQQVLVPDPKTDGTDMHNHEFVGTIVDFRDDRDDMEDYVVVEDGEGNCYDIEPDRLEIVED